MSKKECAKRYHERHKKEIHARRRKRAEGLSDDERKQIRLRENECQRLRYQKNREKELRRNREYRERKRVAEGRVPHVKMSDDERLAKKRKWQREYNLRNYEKVKERNAKWQRENSDYRRTYMKDYHARNPDYSKLSARLFRKRHPDKERESQYRYYHANKEEQAEKGRAWRAKDGSAEKERAVSRRRYHAYPEEVILRNVVFRMLKGLTKSERSRFYVGCSPGFLRNHLEGQFEPGMTWENWGSVWHVDHIVPLSWWDVKNYPEHLEVASHYSNLQPMFKEENMSKGARFVA